MTESAGKDLASDLAEAARRRRERWAISFVAILVAGLTFAQAKMAGVGGPAAFGGNVAIFALININVVLIILLIFLVTRNVFKVLLDRRRNILGSRLRSRLVLIFIGFSLAPTFLLFVAATNLTTTSIRTWIGGRVGAALSGAVDIARKGLETQAGAMSIHAKRAAELIPTSGSPESLRAAMRRALPGDDKAVTIFMADAKGVVATTGALPGTVVPDLLARLSRPSDEAGDGFIFVGAGYAAAAKRVGNARHVVAVRGLSSAESAALREITGAYEEYHQVRLLDDPIRASSIGVLILVTLLIVFTGSWMGIHLAQKITVPVQKLAEGTERLASGDLDARVDYVSDDEFGRLVESFNKMAADLKGARGEIETANDSLRATTDEVRRRNQFIEAILTNISTAVVVLDRSGRISMINKVARRMLRIDPDADLRGRPYHDVIEAAHYEVIRTMIRELGSTGGTSLERQIAVPVDGKEVSLRVALTAVDDSVGWYHGIVVVFDDLSPTMRLQKVLAWREVARRVAHEIRNPLTPIRLSADRLRRRFGEANAADPVFDECVQTIINETSSLKDLVEEFTKFARMPGATLTEGDLAAEVRSVVDTFRQKHSGIDWVFVGDGIPTCWFDTGQLRRAVGNILDNAAAATGGKGRVTTVCSHEPSLGVVRIAVADDGPGVAPEDRERIFEPYFSRRDGGTGLGLAIVGAFAGDHGGNVRVRENMPQGAVFEIEFPVSPRVVNG